MASEFGVSGCCPVTTSQTLAHGLASLQVARELGNIEQLGPILLVGTHIVPQIKFQQNVDPLSLSITLGMETGGELKLGPHKLEPLCQKLPREASVPVTHYGPRQAPILDYVLEEQMGGLLSRAFFGWGTKVAYLEYRSTIASTQLHPSFVGLRMMKSIKTL